MKLYSYIVAHDTGFSPNPFYGYCTLACCKPSIRRTAKMGDWVVGLAPKHDGNGIVFLMRVDETPKTYAEYWRDKRFKAKRPSYDGGVLSKCGDNIYEPNGSGYRQLQSTHSNDALENSENKAHDLGGKYVLISEEVLAAFRSFTQTLKFGIHAAPRHWKEGDNSWKTNKCGCMGRAK